MRELFIFCLTCLFSLPLVRAQERKTADPAPKSMLDGQRLVVRDLNFNIQAPEGWVWLMLPVTDRQFRSFSAYNPAAEMGYAVNVAESQLSLTQATVQDFLDGMAEKLRSSGFSVQKVTLVSTDIPIRASWRFSWKVTLPTGAIMYRFGYVTISKRIYSFTCFAERNAEPPAFLEFVKSFRVLQ